MCNHTDLDKLGEIKSSSFEEKDDLQLFSFYSSGHTIKRNVSSELVQNNLKYMGLISQESVSFL